MRRREFLLLINGAATTWSMTARAQQRTMPVIGFLDPTSPDKYAPFVAAFRNGVGEVGFVEDRNVTIEYRWAEGKYDRLPTMAADLVKRQVAVIVATGITAARAAKAATETIPIVFNTGGDPVKFGLVASLNRPERNVTGVASLGKVLVAKQFELLHELVPKVHAFGFLVNPNNAVAELDTNDAQRAANALGQKLLVAKASNASEIDKAVAALIEQGAGALLMQVDPFLTSRRDQLVALTTRLRIPAVYYHRDFAAAGGLMSYGTSLRD